MKKNLDYMELKDKAKEIIFQVLKLYSIDEDTQEKIYANFSTRLDQYILDLFMLKK